MPTKIIYMTFAALFAGVIGLFKTSDVNQRLPSFSGATEWFNTKPLTPADLRGKVVLVEFWTYTCINWRRTLPYVQAWAEKYKDMGLVVIGVRSRPRLRDTSAGPDRTEKNVANAPKLPGCHGAYTARRSADGPKAYAGA